MHRLLNNKCVEDKGTGYPLFQSIKYHRSQMLQNNHYPRLTVVIKLHLCLHHVIPMTGLLICYLQMAVFHLRTDALGIEYFTTYTLMPHKSHMASR